DGIAHALAERAGGALDAGRFAKLRMAGRLRMELAEILHLLNGEAVTGEVQPAIEKHRTVAGGEDEAVAVDPARILRIMHEGVAVKDGADLGATQGQAKVAGIGLVHGIHGEATGLVGGFGENFSLELHDKNRSIFQETQHQDKTSTHKKSEPGNRLAL